MRDFPVHRSKASLDAFADCHEVLRISSLRVVHSTNLHRAPATFFSSTDSGAILNRFSQDMTLIESQLPVGLLLTLSRM
jgi:ABC-type multidrug transport system fused ATPase/permease subunit